MHVQSLAKSMGFSNVIECNITGVKCNSISLERNGGNLENAWEMINENHHDDSSITKEYVDDCEDEVVYVQSEMEKFRFSPMKDDLKQESCKILGIPYTQNNRSCEIPSRQLGKPCVSTQIVGDGNCFFRAISYSLTDTENYYDEVRGAICQHFYWKIRKIS